MKDRANQRRTLKVRDRRITYPTLELKRVEVRQAPGSRDMAIFCTTAKNVQIQHKGMQMSLTQGQF
jgi:hypothetical protein